LLDDDVAAGSDTARPRTVVDRLLQTQTPKCPHLHISEGHLLPMPTMFGGRLFLDSRVIILLTE